MDPNPIFVKNRFVSKRFDSKEDALDAARRAGLPKPYFVLGYNYRGVAMFGWLVGSTCAVRVASPFIGDMEYIQRSEAAEPWAHNGFRDATVQTTDVVSVDAMRANGGYRLVDTSMMTNPRAVYMREALKRWKVVSSHKWAISPGRAWWPGDEWGYRNRLRNRRDLADAVRNAVHEIRNEDAEYLLEECRNVYDSGDESPLFDALRRALAANVIDSVDAIADALENAGSQYRLRRLDCGHFAVDGHFSHESADGTICNDCREDYRYAEEDGQLHHTDNLHYWDSDEEWHLNPEPDDDDEDNSINADVRLAYSFNVMGVLSVDGSFETSATGDFHMGVELETMLDSRYDVGTRVRDVRAELGQDYLVAKRDGSLDADEYGSGIEWVTRPTSLATHIAKLSSWSATRAGLTAWDPGCCGMHVHIDARAFTALSLGKMIQFYNAKENVALIRRIAGRHPSVDDQAAHYANWDVADKGANAAKVAARKKNPLRALRDKPAGNRYTMVNLTNVDYETSVALRLSPRQEGASNTVEVRIFRASMRKSRQLAQLEFAHALVMFCRVASFLQVNADAFVAWLSENTSRYPHLAKFLDVQPNKHGTFRKQEDPTHADDEEIEMEPTPPDMAVPEPPPDPPPAPPEIWWEESVQVVSGADVITTATANEYRQRIRDQLERMAQYDIAQRPIAPAGAWVSLDPATGRRQTSLPQESMTLQQPSVLRNGDVVRVDFGTTLAELEPVHRAADVLDDDIQF